MCVCVGGGGIQCYVCISKCLCFGQCAEETAKISVNIHSRQNLAMLLIPGRTGVRKVPCTCTVSCCVTHFCQKFLNHWASDQDMLSNLTRSSSCSDVPVPLINQASVLQITQSFVKKTLTGSHAVGHPDTYLPSFVSCTIVRVIFGDICVNASQGQLFVTGWGDGLNDELCIRVGRLGVIFRPRIITSWWCLLLFPWMCSSIGSYGAKVRHQHHSVTSASSGTGGAGIGSAGRNIKSIQIPGLHHGNKYTALHTDIYIYTSQICQCTADLLSRVEMTTMSDTKS